MTNKELSYELANEAVRNIPKDDIPRMFHIDPIAEALEKILDKALAFDKLSLEDENG